MDPPTVALDEAGNTGENLLDAAQPIFALASVHLDEHVAANLLRGLFGERQASELKFASFRRRTRGQRQLVELLESSLLGSENARIAVAHKPWMLASKMVDILVERFANMRGWSQRFYRGGMHLRMADDLYARPATAIGQQEWADLQRTFVAVIRDPDPDGVHAFRVTLEAARATCRAEAICAVLDAMAVSARDLPELAGGEQLDPAPTMLLSK